ncbi:MAG: hypothetical protein ABW175_05040 [Bradyrhizobium sp.]
MNKDFILISVATMAAGFMAWSLVDRNHSSWPVNAEAARIEAHDPALKYYSEHSPYMRTER